jgi:6-phosphogluconolactonase
MNLTAIGPVPSQSFGDQIASTNYTPVKPRGSAAGQFAVYLRMAAGHKAFLAISVPPRRLANEIPVMCLLLAKTVMMSLMPWKTCLLGICAIGLVLFVLHPAASAEGGPTVDIYIGTYTGPKSQGIYRAKLDIQTGALSEPVLAGKTDNPSYIIQHPHGKFLYAVNENGMEKGKEAGAVSSFAIDAATGNLTAINRQPSHGTYPCHISIDPTGKCLMVANYGTGTFASYPLADDGSIGPAASVIQDTGTGPNKARQEGPHAHGIWPWPALGNLVLGCDLGTDKLMMFALDPATASLKPAVEPSFPFAPATGPRHLAAGPNKSVLYVIGELANTISVVAIGAGQPDAPPLNPFLIQTISTLPKGFTGKNTAAEVAVHPNGKFLYATNRGADDLVTYAIDSKTGKLAEIARTPAAGRGPRDFVIDPTGKWLLVANQDSGSITTFAIDPATGQPRQVGDPLAIASPVCILFRAP